MSGNEASPECDRRWLQVPISIGDEQACRVGQARITLRYTKRVLAEAAIVKRQP